MIWNRSQTIALAKTACSHCHGYGLRPGRNGREVPCNCVLRAIFRIFHGRFRRCVTEDRHLSQARIEICCGGKDNRMAYGRKVEEYIADFCLVSRNALTTLEYDIFRFHYLLGADWKLCCWRLKLDRGTFFHLLYKIEQKLGRVFRELQPYSLFPLDEYFGGTMRNERTAPPLALVPKRSPARVLRPPVRLSAA
jgi:hypothetical protein